MSGFMNKLIDEIFRTKPIKSKYPLWLHALGKVALLALFGYLTWFRSFWLGSFMTSLFFGMLFFNVLITLFFGHVIKRWVREIAS